MMIALILVGVLLISILCFYKPQLGLGLLIVLLPFDHLGTFALNPSGHPVVRLSQLAAIALVAGVMLRVILSRDKLRAVAGWRWLIALGGIALIPVVLNLYFPLLKDYLSALLMLATYYVVAHTSPKINPATLEKLILFTASTVSIFGLLQFVGDLLQVQPHLLGLLPQYSRTVFGFPRIQSTFSEPLFFANYLLLPLLLVLGLNLQKITPLRQSILALIFINFILTMSRGGFAAAGVGVVVLGVLLRKEVFAKARGFAKILPALFVGLIAAVSLIIISSKLSYGNYTLGPKTFLAQLGTAVLNSASFSERSLAREQAIRVWSGSPLVGYGVGGYSYKVADYPEIAPGRVASNNQTLELLVEVGVLGLICYAGLVVSILISGFKVSGQPTEVSKYWRFSLVAAIIAIMVQYQTFSGFYIMHIWVALGLLAGMAFQSNNKRLAVHMTASQ